MREQNKLFTLTIITSLALLAGCQSAPSSSATIACETTCDSDNPKIVFAATEHHFGKVAAGAKQTCSFEFINDGGQDLVIENIHASCGCTTTTTANTMLKPGQASEIAVTYTAGSFNGKAKKQVMVYTNDPENPQVALWIAADIVGAAKEAQTQTASLNPAASKPVSPKTPKDTMPKALKQSLKNLNKATGG